MSENYIGKLQEKFQKAGQKLPLYEFILESDDISPTFQSFLLFPKPFPPFFDSSFFERCAENDRCILDKDFLKISSAWFSNKSLAKKDLAAYLLMLLESDCTKTQETIKNDKPSEKAKVSFETKFENLSVEDISHLVDRISDWRKYKFPEIKKILALPSEGLNECLFIQAFLHSSFVQSKVACGKIFKALGFEGEYSSYERLEFLGDSCLGFVVATLLIELNKKYSPG